ncbi:MAG: hypothetical protein AAFQ87_26965, partial [Bacteroidota bacterium]
ATRSGPISGTKPLYSTPTPLRPVIGPLRVAVEMELQETTLAFQHGRLFPVSLVKLIEAKAKHAEEDRGKNAEKGGTDRL